ncbi:DUF58 domain-containing protein [Aquabacter cavernae]|uniref:DUF58 domain-containing protein n=1 Tax=Aquabacter cavernae TaxID=2496029 RepID=UPI000F8EDC07|nr:DUF58 domain-containing protein [Aquabacter cavernae]
MAALPDDEWEGVVARFADLAAARPHPGGKGVRAPKARSQMLGGHRSAARGRGMEFDEVRAYQPGDDVRTIDWRVTARTGRPHTKLFQEERERPVLILIDLRSHMRFGTRVSFKSVLAARAAAMACWMSLDAGDRVGGVILTPFAITSFRPQRSRAQVLGFVKAIADATAEGIADPPPKAEPTLSDALGNLRQVSRPGTQAFVLSDFHDFDEAALRELGRISLHCQVANILVFDRLEAEMPERGRFRVSDGRAVGFLDADGTKTRDAYAQRFVERQETLADMAHKRGMTLRLLETGTDPADLFSPRGKSPGSKGGARLEAAE